MIVRSIRLEGWRCFAAPVELGPFGEGLNVVYGPNGVGKSTVMMALVRALFDSHKVGGDEVKALRPWGRSLNPKVTVEFQKNGSRYRLHKQFLSAPSAHLSRLEKSQFVPVAESLAADEQARQILSGDASLRGVTKQQHWGLAQILWAAQGDLELHALSPGTRATITDALGGQLSGPAVETIETRIAETYQRFFTPTGQLRGGASAPAIVGLRSERETAEVERAALLRRLAEFEAASRRIEDLRGRTNQAKQSEHGLTETVKGARERAQLYKDVLAQQKLHQQEVSSAEDRYTTLKTRADAIISTRAQQRSAVEQLARLEDDLPAQAKQVDQCRAVSDRAKQALEQVRSRRPEVQAARQASQRAERFASARQERAGLDNVLEQVRQADQERNELCEQRSHLVAPNKGTLQQIKKAARARDDARLRLDAAVITIRIEPESATTLEISAAEEPGTKSVAANEPVLLKGCPHVAFRLPGIARIEATGPSAGTDELRRLWSCATEELGRLSAGFGTQDVDLLEQLHAQAADLDAKTSQIETKIATLLGRRELEEIRSNRARESQILEELLAEFPAWEVSGPDAAALAKEAEDVERRFTADVDAAEAENDRAGDALNRALQKQSAYEADLKGASQQIQDIEKRLAALTEDRLDDAQRGAACIEIALARDVARGKLAEVDGKLRTIGDDPARIVGVFEAQLDATRKQADDSAKELNIEEGRLQQIAAEAPYSALATVEEQIDRLTAEIARQQLQIDAIRLLYETLKERKREMLSSVLGPVRARANRTLERIVGGQFKEIQFDESMLPAGIAPISTDEAISLDALSGGEREQLYFAVRLALADVAFQAERQLVVLDDVFIYTDTARLARIVTILDEAADRFQIVLLTCHPERYRGLPNAKFFDLEAIVRNGASAPQATAP
jgi:DNA repair exonuclease SbcCD ATPase subunit